MLRHSIATHTAPCGNQSKIGGLIPTDVQTAFPMFWLKQRFVISLQFKALRHASNRPGPLGILRSILMSYGTGSPLVAKQAQVSKGFVGWEIGSVDSGQSRRLQFHLSNGVSAFVGSVVDSDRSFPLPKCHWSSQYNSKRCFSATPANQLVSWSYHTQDSGWIMLTR